MERAMKGEIVRIVGDRQRAHAKRLIDQAPIGFVMKLGAETRRDGRWHRTFHRRGYYKYVCTLHQGMTGSVLVK